MFLTSLVLVLLLAGALGSLKLLSMPLPLPETAANNALYQDEPEESLRSDSMDGAQQQQVAEVLLSRSEQGWENLERRLDAAVKRHEEIRAAALQEWRDAQVRQFSEYSQQLQGLTLSVQTLEERLAQLLEADQTVQTLVNEKPMFQFRGIEIWNGQVYALLEYQGAILPVRQGEARLGWRIHEIDREQRQLHVSDGTRQYVLEES